MNCDHLITAIVVSPALRICSSKLLNTGVRWQGLADARCVPGLHARLRRHADPEAQHLHRGRRTRPQRNKAAGERHVAELVPRRVAQRLKAG